MKIMGILNINDDSFFEKSRYPDPQEALKKAEEMIAQGADIIDIGGESTRPGAGPISLEEELKRVIPVIRKVAQLGTPISIDTYKGEVALAALEAGATIVNDVSGGKYDPYMFSIAAQHRAQLVIMHNPIQERELPHAAKEPHRYTDILQEVCADLKMQAQKAQSAGMVPRNIVLDPGIGFRKRREDNITLLRDILQIKDLGYHVLIGASNKRFIGDILNVEKPEERLEGTLAITAHSYIHAVDVVRVHDVQANKRTVRMLEALATV